MKKLLSLFLAVLLAFACVSVGFAAEDAYVITNPYAGVDWGAYSAYKTALHSHTNASDGTPTLKQSIGRHLEAGFDIVAVTDHGVLDESWESGPDSNVIKALLSALGRSEGELEYLGAQGTFDNGVGYTLRSAGDGDQFLAADNGRQILKVPYGTENNAVSVNAHINSWFRPYNNNTVSTYEEAARGIQKAGALGVINHPGEYTKARYELRTENAYNESNASYAYYINKYASLLAENSALIGIDMNSKGDNRTRFDRKLWDILLTRFAANGQNVYGICSSDAHQLGVIDTGFTLLLMPELTSAAARTALENGQFFGASHCLGNYDELLEIAAALEAFYGTSHPVYARVKQAADAMAQRIADVESGVLPADEDIGITYTTLDGEGYAAAATFPAVTGITVNDAENVISLQTENALLVRFISNGKAFAVKRADGAEIDLDDYAPLLGDYVRAEVFGEGGMLYTQAFLLNAEQNTGASDPVRGVYFNAGVLDFLLAVFKNWRDIISRFFAVKLGF